MSAALLAAGCGSSSSTDTFSAVPDTFGRGGIRATPEQLANSIRALDPGLLQGANGGGFKVMYATTLPTSFQLPAAIIPPVQNQGVLESCGGFGIGYCLGTAMAALANPGLDVTNAANQASAAFMYKTAYTAEGLTNALADQSGPNSGTYAVDYFNQLIGGGGSATWSAMGYPSASLGERAMCSDLDQLNLGAALVDGRFALGSTAHINGPQDVTGANPLARIKGYLASGVPVAFLTELYNNFNNFSGSGVFKGTGSPNDGGHFMCLLGYDDSQGAFLVQNSWGTSWGNQGRFWWDYASFEKALYQAYVGFPVGQGSGGSTLTGGAGGAISRAFQAVGGEDNRAHLILHVHLNRPHHLKSMALRPPQGPGMTFLHAFHFRSGFLYARRLDEARFRSGTWTLELETVDGHTLTGPFVISPVDNGPQADLDDQVVGSHGGRGVPWG